MYERLKKLYQEGRLSKDGLYNAVAKGWITQEQADEIIESTTIRDYVKKIKNGEMTINEVPTEWRDKVAILFHL